MVGAAATELVEKLDCPRECGDDRPAAATAIQMPSYPAQLKSSELLLEVVRQLLRGSVAVSRRGCAGPTHESLDAAFRQLDTSVMPRTRGQSLLTPFATAAAARWDEVDAYFPVHPDI